MKRVLFVRLSAMGDVVQGLGAVAALRQVRPDWHATFVTQEPWADLVRAADGVDRVVTFARHGGLSAVWRLRRELRAERYDVAIDLQGNWKSAFVARLSGARTCIGMAAAWRQEPMSRVLLRRTVACAAVPHPARAAFELVRSLAPEAPFRRPRLVATAVALAAERRAIAAAGIAVDAPFRVVVVTDPADPRALPQGIVESMSRDAQRPVVLLFGPAEAHLAGVDGVASVRHGLGEVRRLIALGQIVRANGGDVVGPDQGATHVLAAAGAECRVLFGAQDPRRTSPAAAIALVHPEPPACAPCRRRRCTHPDGPVCMQFLPERGCRMPTGLPDEG